VTDVPQLLPLGLLPGDVIDAVVGGERHGRRLAGDVPLVPPGTGEHTVVVPRVVQQR
jgi:hypothetical protein